MAELSPEDYGHLEVLPSTLLLPRVPGPPALEQALRAVIDRSPSTFSRPTPIMGVPRAVSAGLPWQITPDGALYPWKEATDLISAADEKIALHFHRLDDAAWGYSQRTRIGHHRASASNHALREAVQLVEAIPPFLNALEVARLHRDNNAWASRRATASLLWHIAEGASRTRIFRLLHDRAIPLDWTTYFPIRPVVPIMDIFPDSSDLPTAPLPPNGFVIPAPPPGVAAGEEALLRQAGLQDGPVPWLQAEEISDLQMHTVTRALESVRFINASQWAELRLHEYARSCEDCARLLQPFAYGFGLSFKEYVAAAATRKRARAIEKRAFMRHMTSLHPLLRRGVRPRAALHQDDADRSPADLAQDHAAGSSKDPTRQLPRATPSQQLAAGSSSPPSSQERGTRTAIGLPPWADLPPFGSDSGRPDREPSAPVDGAP